ncbi:hypothetical protein Ga0466249_005385 [Sporomusaceae bacterium BoRhaA]|nr:hypothetical protein [Pelorhabdus rhamnosifermentans]
MNQTFVFKVTAAVASFVKYNREYLRKFPETSGISVVPEEMVVVVSVYQRFKLLSSGLICSLTTGGVVASAAVV